MAFVFRSDKITLFSAKKEEFEIGPGQYLAQDNPIKNIRSGKVPFLSGSPKEDGLEQPTKSPGPGAYFIHNHVDRTPKDNKSKMEKEKLETIKAYQNLNQEDLPNLSFLLNSKQNSGNLGFNVSDTRFKQDPQIYVPGPGHYLKSQDKAQLDKWKNSTSYLKKLNKYPVFRSDLNDTKKIISIPNKHQSYGYELKEGGYIQMNQDPEKFKKFKGDKLDSVGPGNYDMTKTTSWLRNCPDWGKSKFKKFETRDTEIKNKKIYSDQNYVTAGDFTKQFSKSFDKGEYDELNKKASMTMRTFSLVNKFKTSKLLKSNTIRKTNRKTFYNDILDVMDLSSKIDMTQRGISQETPGPGYYYQNYRPMMPGNFPKNQNFLSNQERFKEKEANDSLGPGCYYREEDRLNFNKNYNKIIKDKQSVINQSKDRSNTTCGTSNLQDNPGPGQYDPDIFYKGKKTFSSQSFFGSTERRFTRLSNQRKENNPGPGYYQTVNNTSGFNIMGDKLSLKNLRQKKLTNLIEKVKPKKTENKLSQDYVPPVGSYNPQNLFNIDYKLKKKMNKLTLVETAFNSSLGQTRFNENNEEINGGPGYYYKEKKKSTFQEYRPFNSIEKRFKEPKPDFVINGPGNYYHSGYHDWNKKTFNILYL